MNVSKPQASIQWLQVCSLAAVQGAITLSWVIYNLYLVRLLVQLGLPESLAKHLLMVENLLAVGMEPLMGALSDRQQRWLGTRFPLIALGVILSAGLFILIPLVVLLGPSIALTPWLLQGLAITWALAMTLFRSPVIVLLANYAFATKLPQAFSVLTLTGGLVGALRPLASGFILGLGPTVTFAIGSGVLLGATVVLRIVHAQLPPSEPSPAASNPHPFPLKALTVLFVLGLLIAGGTRLMMGEILPKLLQANYPAINLNLSLGLLSIALALFALAAGVIATRIGNAKTMIIGAGGTAACLTLLTALPSFLLPIVLLISIAALSPVVNGTIPLALELAPARWGGLAIGTYFGGFSLAMVLYSAWMTPGVLTPAGTILLGVLLFILAGISIAVGDRFCRKVAVG
ncbi:MAG: MFS transporter [Leptolyngbyaceae cyanobacterium bins.59]|nr:MFS transporter [Leptolyngbyaceae cyanobacterium bins.59]